MPVVGTPVQFPGRQPSAFANPRSPTPVQHSVLPVYRSWCPWFTVTTHVVVPVSYAPRSTPCRTPIDSPSSLMTCLLYTSDAADEEDSVDLGGRRIIKKKK